MENQHSNFKHFCKICKKGFMDGRALGGHMRAHGIGDEGGYPDEEDEPAGDSEGKHDEPIPPGTKHMYALRTKTNRLKSCRKCENCGKQFSTWKLFLEHGKCSNSEDVESLVSSHDSQEEEDGVGRKGYGWSKRKRTLRVKIDSGNRSCPSSQEEDLAKCLMMLSNAKADASIMEPEESSTSAMNVVSPFTYREPSSYNLDKAKGIARGLFECKACKKVFNSHQALGGHRASHKKVKGCFAARIDDPVDEYIPDDDVITHEEFLPTKSTSNLTFDHGPSSLVPSSSKRKAKVHECSICHRVFSSGQALGGHKRCHWITSNSPDTSCIAKLQEFYDHLEQIQRRPKFLDADPLVLKLDLNQPAPSLDDLAGSRRDPTTRFDLPAEMYIQSWLGLNGKEKEAMQTLQQNHQVNNIGKALGSDKNGETANNDSNNNKENTETESNVVDDECESKMKLAKLSELADLNMRSCDESSSSWLQVGIGMGSSTRTA